MVKSDLVWANKADICGAWHEEQEECSMSYGSRRVSEKVLEACCSWDGARDVVAGRGAGRIGGTNALAAPLAS